MSRRIVTHQTVVVWDDLNNNDDEAKFSFRFIDSPSSISFATWDEECIESVGCWLSGHEYLVVANGRVKLRI